MDVVEVVRGLDRGWFCDSSTDVRNSYSWLDPVAVDLVESGLVGSGSVLRGPLNHLGRHNEDVLRVVITPFPRHPLRVYRRCCRLGGGRNHQLRRRCLRCPGWQTAMRVSNCKMGL